MSRAQDDRRWTILIVRPGDARSRSLAVGPWQLGLAALLTVAVLGVAFVWLGRWAERSRGADRVAVLRDSVARLTEQTTKVDALARSLSELEERYGRLARVMSGEITPATRDVRLPVPERGEGAEEARSATPPADLVWPLVEPSFVTRAWDDTTAAPFAGHRGIDIAIPSGSYVRAIAAGRVEEAGRETELGLHVRIHHASGLRSLYAHASELFVSAGDSVLGGEVIALSGSSGRSTAPHLHLEVEREGEAVDPLALLAGDAGD